MSKQLKIKPLGDKVVVQRSKAQTSKGGILLPDSAQEKPREGVVLATGPGKANEQGQVEPLTVEPGDKVLFGAYAGTEVRDEEEEYLILAEGDILGVLV